MDKEERVAREKKSRQWVIDNFSVEVIGKQLEDIIDNMPPVDYDFESEGLDYNPDYEPKENYVSHQEFLIDIYKNILCDDVDENSQGFKHWMTQLQAGKTPLDIVNYFKNVAIQEKQKIELPDLEQLLSKESGSKKIAIVIPHSDVDVFLINALLKNLKSQYKKHNLYIFTQPQFYPFIDDNPAVYKLLPYNPIIENQLTMEGVSDHEGFFEMVFYPHATTQKSLSYLHNGVNKHQFSLR